MKSKIKTSKGFTLLEMLIVVSIVAILIAIAFPVLKNQKQKAIDATNKANIKSAIDLAIASNLSDHFKSDASDWNTVDDSKLVFYSIDDNEIVVTDKLHWQSLGGKYKGENFDWVKRNGLYRYILIVCVEGDEGQTVVKTKPFIDNEGKVRLGLGKFGAICNDGNIIRGESKEGFTNPDKIYWYNKDSQKHENVLNHKPNFSITKKYPISEIR